MSFNIDFSKATNAYKINKEIIQSQFSGDLYSLELEKNDLNDLFDKKASTDILYRNKKGLIYGIAMRVNFIKKNYKSMTIRYTRANGICTEYDKTIAAIKNNAITSYIGIQIDVDNESKLLRGVIYNRFDLFNYILNNKDVIKDNLHYVYDGNTYLKFTYDDLNKFNINNKVF